MELIGARSGYDRDLRPRALSVFRSVVVLHQFKFADGIHTQKLSAGAAGRHIDLEEPVYSIPFKRKRFASGRCPETENMLPTAEADVPTPPARSPVTLTMPGIQSQKIVEAPAIQRQILHLPLAH